MKFVVIDGLRDTRLMYKREILTICPYAEVFQCMSAEDAIFTTLDNDPDVIISSEILSFRTGFELAGLLNKIKIKIPVIIIANDTSNALLAIKNNVFDYLISPFDDKKLQVSIKNAIDFIDEDLKRKRVKKYAKHQKIKINTTKGYKLIDLDNLAFCKADGSYTYLGYIDGSHDFSSYTLGRVCEILDNYHFVRINRSSIVNMKQIAHVDKANNVCSIYVNEELQGFSISRAYLRKLESEKLF